MRRVFASSINTLKARQQPIRSFCGLRAGEVGFAFDVDGVLLRGNEPIPGAKHALARLQRLSVPFVVLTNNGGMTEATRAAQLTDLLNVPVEADQVVLSHSAMADAAADFANELVLVVGSKDYVSVAADLGLKNAVTPRDIMACHPQISPYFSMLPGNSEAGDVAADANALVLEDIAAILILHDPVEWSFELQICLDLLRGGNPIGSGQRQAIPLLTSNSDFTYMAAWPVPRFAQGPFHECLSLLFQRTTGRSLVQQSFGKPFKVQFDYARQLLLQRQENIKGEHSTLDQVFMIGDNPSADIRGANGAGDPWQSVLVRTGVFNSGAKNDPIDPADFVFDDVGQAVEALLE